MKVNSIRADQRLLINNFTPYQCIKIDNHSLLYTLHTGITPIYYDLTLVDVPDWPYTRQLTNVHPVHDLSSARPPEDTPNKEHIDSLKFNITWTLDPPQTKT